MPFVSGHLFFVYSILSEGLFPLIEASYDLFTLFNKFQTFRVNFSLPLLFDRFNLFLWKKVGFGQPLAELEPRLYLFELGH